jgi:hypothetical protein
MAPVFLQVRTICNWRETCYDATNLSEISDLGIKMSYISNAKRVSRGPADKPFRDALRMELAAAGENMMALREIAKVHIAKCKEGDMQAIKELRDTLDGRPAQAIEHVEQSGDASRVTKIVHEFVHVNNKTPEELAALNEAEKLRANGSGGLNGNGCDRDQP